MTDLLDAVFVVGAEARLLELRDYISRMDADKQLALKELIDSAVTYRFLEDKQIVAFRAILYALRKYVNIDVEANWKEVVEILSLIEAEF